MGEGQFTQIPNRLLEALISSGLSKNELIILITIIRFTYGINKNRLLLTCSLNPADIHRLTSIKIGDISPKLSFLKSKKIISWDRGKGLIGLNCCPEQWDVESKLDEGLQEVLARNLRSPKKAPITSRIGNETVPEKETSLLEWLTRPKYSIKENKNINIRGYRGMESIGECLSRRGP